MKNLKNLRGASALNRTELKKVTGGGSNGCIRLGEVCVKTDECCPGLECFKGVGDTSFTCSIVIRG